MYDLCFRRLQPLSLFAIQFLNAVGDLLDLIPALAPGVRPPMGGLRWPEMGHCSALIKVRGHQDACQTAVWGPCFFFLNVF